MIDRSSSARVRHEFGGLWRVCVQDHVLAYLHPCFTTSRVCRPLLVLFGHAIASQGADSAERYCRTGDQPQRRRDPDLRPRLPRPLSAVFRGGYLGTLPQLHRDRPAPARVDHRRALPAGPRGPRPRRTGERTRRRTRRSRNPLGADGLRAPRTALRGRHAGETIWGAGRSGPWAPAPGTAAARRHTGRARRVRTSSSCLEGSRPRLAGRPQPAAVHPALHGRSRPDAEAVRPRAPVPAGAGVGAGGHRTGLGGGRRGLRVFRPVAPDPRLRGVLRSEPRGLPEPEEQTRPSQPRTVGRVGQFYPIPTPPPPAEWAASGGTTVVRRLPVELSSGGKPCRTGLSRDSSVSGSWRWAVGRTTSPPGPRPGPTTRTRTRSRHSGPGR